MYDYVWYCSYGSNMLFERFRLYIKGGTANFVDKTYKGCADKTLPSQNEGYNIPYEIYFAETATHWENLGVAFLKHKKNELADTIGRIYKIRRDQFIEIFQQENGIDPNSSLINLDFEQLENTGQQTIGSSDENRRYGKLLWLGKQEEIPVLSFTAKWNEEEVKFNKPGEKYLTTIIKGIIEFTDISEDEMFDYLINKDGIKGFYNKDSILKIVSTQKYKWKRLTVGKTDKRGDTGGELIVQLDQNTFRNNEIGEYVLLRNKLALNSHIEVPALVRFRKQEHPNIIGLDQKLRTALALEEGVDIYVSTEYAKNKLKRKGRLLRNFFGTQMNLVRVYWASYNDMEINMCRIKKESMDSINIRESDVIVIESPTSKIKLPVFELTESLIDELDKKIYKKKGDKQCEEVEKFKANNKEGEDIDLFPILIDLDARDILAIKPGCPVRIYRSIENEIYKRLHLISIPLILTLIGALVSFQYLADTIKLLILVLSVIIIFTLNFIGIKSIVKFSVSSQSKKNSN